MRNESILCTVLRYEKIKTPAHQENVLTLEDVT